MGQHKHNPNCTLAKQGKLPPKPKGPSKAERTALLNNLICEAMFISVFGQGKNDIMISKTDGDKNGR